MPASPSAWDGLSSDIFMQLSGLMRINKVRLIAECISLTVRPEKPLKQ
jgi:hypothetical protein